MDQQIKNLEEQLASLKAKPLNGGLFARLEHAMHDCTPAGDLRKVEGELACLVPEELSEDQFDQLEGAMEGAEVEQELADLSPAQLDASFLSHLEQLMENASAEPKLVAFEPTKRKRVPIAIWASVAATIIFTLTGLVAWPSADSGEEELVEASFPSSDDLSEPYSISEFGEGRREVSQNIVNASNEGVIMSKGRPVRRVKIYFNEVRKSFTKDGKRLEITLPKQRVILVPVETN